MSLSEYSADGSWSAFISIRGRGRCTKEVTQGNLVLSSDQGHLENGGFDVDRILKLLSDAVDQALNEGYKGLFVTGDMGWAFGPERDFCEASRI